jgi:hypothetical protein
MDLAQGHTALVAASPIVNSNREPFHAYNFGSGTGMAVVKVVSSFEKAFILKVPVVPAPRLDGYVGFCVAAISHASRAEAELDWKTTNRVEEFAKDASEALPVLPKLFTIHRPWYQLSTFHLQDVTAAGIFYPATRCASRSVKRKERCRCRLSPVEIPTPICGIGPNDVRTFACNHLSTHRKFTDRRRRRRYERRPRRPTCTNSCTT